MKRGTVPLGPNLSPVLGDDEITASRPVEQQQSKQKRRRSQAGRRGSSLKTSIWSTLAATVSTVNDKCIYLCRTCAFQGTTNNNYSTSNIIHHYKTKHTSLYADLMSLNAANVPEKVLQARIEQQRGLLKSRTSEPRSERFFSSPNVATLNEECVSSSTPTKILQAVATVMFSCATETSSCTISSPLLQGFIDIFGGHIQFSSKELTNKTLFDTYSAICRILRTSVTNAKIGCITVDGWSAALGNSLLRITWHYIDEQWNKRCIPVATLNLGKARKTGAQLRCIIQEILEQNMIIGSNDIRLHTATSNNEAAMARCMDLLTNFAGSVRCIAHTLAWVVDDVFENGTIWKKYLDHVNKVTTYFNHHQKAAQLLAQKQVSDGITSAQLQRLKQDIPIRWQSRLAAMSVYLCQIETVSAVASELCIPAGDLPSLCEDQQDLLAEFVTVLTEVRRVARQLEAERNVTMSRAPRLIRELHETLLIMSGDMLSGAQTAAGDVGPLLDEDAFEIYALPCRASVAKADEERDKARVTRLRFNHAKALAVRLATRIESRNGLLWRRVDENCLTRVQEAGEPFEPDMEMKEARRVLLFHVAAILDVNECCLDFLSCTDIDRENYMKLLYSAVVHEAVELDSGLAPNADELVVVFSLLHRQMRLIVETNGRRESDAALSFWKDANTANSLVSPVPFNTIARAALSSQASSAPAERLFSDSGLREGIQRHSILSSTSEMTEIIRAYVSNELRNTPDHQDGSMHPKGQAFRRLVHAVASEVVKQTG